jgi:hypothetical protein
LSITIDLLWGDNAAFHHEQDSQDTAPTCGELKREFHHRQTRYVRRYASQLLIFCRRVISTAPEDFCFPRHETDSG